MTVRLRVRGRTLTAAVRGELDRATGPRRVHDRAWMSRSTWLCPAADSGPVRPAALRTAAGIAVLIRVSRRMEQIKGELIVRGVPPQPWKVFQAAGLHKLIRF